MSILLKSEAFEDGKPIPTRFTADGEDISPPLTWDHLPPQTQELALVVDDPDAPRPEPFVHWVIYKIPPDAPGLLEAIGQHRQLRTPPGALQGNNSMDQAGYMGPKPPRGHGVHHYHFHLYALDEPLDVEPGLSKEALLASIAGHVLDEAEVVGTYER
ncbi:MAG TPA: YbhB/YbcL family Raf kinase inhibitor-like protein [Tepidisphaeraceae bacterium]|nr:YbhB/YbcL family Raf kinase inhibitor-like protein [Tepidisphaeraceae bacterium]